MRAHPTEAEKRLWSLLRGQRLSGFKFRRQQVIVPYIVDFVCLEQRLIIETDGSQHADCKDDVRRDAFLRAQGFRILRYWNNQILSESEAVAAALVAELSVPHPPKPSAWAPPSPAAGRGDLVELPNG
jgi:very-short-patch-repair endonuclease